MNRLEFLKLSALSVAFPDVLKNKTIQPVGSAASNSGTEDSTPSNPACYYWNKQTRLTIAMWDFSWLTDQGQGGKFENIEQRVAEAAARGYNTLRVDCFPSRLLEKETVFSKTYNPGEAKTMPCWGQVTTEVRCNALQKLKQLADACRKHNIWLGLDSWEKGHMMSNFKESPLVLSSEHSVISENQEEKILRNFAHTWSKAIRLMRETGILERAVWVAPMNEVPHFASRSLESIRKIAAHDQNEGNVKIDKDRLTNDRFKQINHWIGEEIKEEIRREGIPLSYSSLGAEEYNQRLTDIYDVVDIHFMPNVILNSQEAAEFESLGKGVSGGMNFQSYAKINLKRYSELWDKACRNHYAEMLQRTRNYLTTALDHLTLSGGKKMQGVITESFGPCFWPDHLDVSWEWYKHYNGDSARIAASMPFEGISLSNYGEPLFTLWQDEDWHRNANLFILNVKQ